MICVILAGGQGTRLWPMSRKKKPKQFFPVIGSRTMIENTYARLAKRFKASEIFIAANPDLIPKIQETLPWVEWSQLIVEPAKRDSGPAIAYACSELSQRGYEDESVAFVSTDHHILKPDRFIEHFDLADELIQSHGKMLDISVPPEFANTALGYTKVASKIDHPSDIEVYEFAAHTEKPDLDTANDYIASGNYLWHTGYYMWTPKAFLDAYKSYAPEIFEKIQLMKEQPKRAQAIFEGMPAISIDYAVTEKMDPSNVLIIKGDFGWSDVGTWDVVYDQTVKANEDMVKRGNIHALDCKNTLIYSGGKKVIAAMGLQEMIVVDTDDALLICPKDKAAKIKELISLLKENADHVL